MRTRRLILATLLSALLLPGATRGEGMEGEEMEGTAAPASPATPPVSPAAAAQPPEPVHPAAGSRPPELETFFYRCRCAKGDILKDVLDSLVTPRGRVVFSEALNTLILVDERGHMDSLRDALARLDTMQPQVQVVAKVVEITMDEDTEKEVNLTFNRAAETGRAVLQDSFSTLPTPGAVTDATRGLGLRPRLYSDRVGGDSVDGFIRLLITQNKAKILSSPTLVVAGGSESNIITGEDVPVQSSQVVGGSINTTTEFKRVGIKLKVTPLHIGKDTVQLMVAPEVSSVSSYTTGTNANPIVAIRNTRTILNVKDGQSIVIGGLRREETRHITRKVPLLGDIPLLGLLFRSERDQTVNTMLVFTMQVTILRDGAAPPKIPAESGDPEPVATPTEQKEMDPGTQAGGKE